MAYFPVSSDGTCHRGPSRSCSRRRRFSSRLNQDIKGAEPSASLSHRERERRSYFPTCEVRFGKEGKCVCCQKCPTNRIQHVRAECNYFIFGTDSKDNSVIVLLTVKTIVVLCGTTMYLHVWNADNSQNVPVFAPKNTRSGNSDMYPGTPGSFRRRLTSSCNLPPFFFFTETKQTVLPRCRVQRSRKWCHYGVLVNMPVTGETERSTKRPSYPKFVPSRLLFLK